MTERVTVIQHPRVAPTGNAHGGHAALLVSVLLAMLVAAVPAAADDRSPVECRETLEAMRAQGLEMINQERATAGVPPVRAHTGLDAVAQDWSLTMAITGNYEHRPRFWDAYPSEMVGGAENINQNPVSRADAAALHVEYVHSPGHYDNMIGEQHTHVGLGYVCVQFVEDGFERTRVFNTQNFGVHHSGAAVGPAPPPLPRPLPEACPASLITPTRFYDIRPDGHGHSVLCMDAWGIADAAGSAWGHYPLYLPQHAATRAEFAEMLHRLLHAAGAAPTGSTAGRFTDVPDDHPNARAINALTTIRVINGVSETHFAPERPVTRGAMASLIVRAHDNVFAATFKRADGFSDTAGTTHEENIRQLVGGEITQGFSDGTYRPNADMTRAQMATFHARYADLLVRNGRAQPPRSRHR